LYARGRSNQRFALAFSRLRSAARLSAHSVTLALRRSLHSVRWLECRPADCGGPLRRLAWAPSLRPHHVS